MKALVNHRGLSLADDAADALARFERVHGVQPITSAYRSAATQQGLIDRWNRGGRLNRPPYLYEPASIKASKHISGKAIDTSAPDVFHKYGAAFGFYFNYSYDKVHFEYDGARDPSKPHATGNSAVKDRQVFLIVARGEHIQADGIDGKATQAAVKRYQKFLRLYGYVGPIDGKWGAGTQTAHSKYYTVWRNSRR